MTNPPAQRIFDDRADQRRLNGMITAILAEVNGPACACLLDVARKDARVATALHKDGHAVAYLSTGREFEYLSAVDWQLVGNGQGMDMLDRAVTSMAAPRLSRSSTTTTAAAVTLICDGSAMRSASGGSSLKKNPAPKRMTTSSPALMRKRRYPWGYLLSLPFGWMSSG